MIRLCLLLAFAAFALPAAAQSVRVVDGGTLEIDGLQVRLFGIDAPQRGQRGAVAAVVHLHKLIARGTVICILVDERGGPVPRGADRPAALCTAGHADLSLSLLRAGNAVAWCPAIRRARPDLWPAFKRAEDEAKEKKAGLWSRPPAEWRDGGCGE